MGNRLFSNSSIETDCNVGGNEATSTSNDVHDVYPQLKVMIDNEEWGGISQFLHEHQHTTTNDGAADIRGIFKIIASNGLLVTLLTHLKKQRDDEEAKSLVVTLLKLGGKDFIMEKYRVIRENALHLGCYMNAPSGVLLKLIEAGGRDLVFDKNSSGSNPLHRACMNKRASLEVVSKIIEVGGRDVVLVQNDAKMTPLHLAILIGASTDVVLKLIKVGGRDLVHTKKEGGSTPLQCASRRTDFSKLLPCFIEAGGRELFLERDIIGLNPIHGAFSSFHPAEKGLLNLLIKLGGPELLAQKDYLGSTPLQHVVIQQLISDSDEEDYNKELLAILSNNMLTLMIKGIQLEIGGEYAIGGLFSHTPNQDIRDRIFHNWNKLVLPALDHVMALPCTNHLPLLQAVIAFNAPPDIIKTIVRRFPDTINIADCHGMYPIDIAVRHRLAWDDGTKQIAKAFASTQQTTELHVCTKHGVQWENGTKEVLERSDVDVVEREDVSTGLYPFMLAAVEGEYKCDFGSVYHLIKSSPNLVIKYEEKNNLK